MFKLTLFLHVLAAAVAWHIAAVTVISVAFVFVGVAFRAGGLW